ncbi:DUF1800 domain-containing protein [Gloeobacter morelensis]|uniref:DUF1800 domain-containing protein n=1 Tax=Gloeobacter morelensis MG652769 TaxID=2781736 RepID=A0ABY3PGK4_9CYAN|nr:DUF1800 domain-containing protein [Gloeobacter morelensis]UFP92777.1 DUF1800 domain-containing protein [Gloeobacter morelensis MG652769]
MQGWQFLGSAILAAVLSGATSASAVAAQTAANAQVLHVLNRLGYGPRPGDIERVSALGVERYIQQQLWPETISEPTALLSRLAGLESQRMSSAELARTFGPPPGSKQPATRRSIAPASPDELEQAREAYRQRLSGVARQAMQARLLRAVESPRQLQEVMTDFWFNHFNVYANKGLTRLWVGSYEQEAIRPNTLGRFSDLLAATARHPAMLFYLDNWQNTGPGTPGAQGRRLGLNENYARELLELHTLGVDGGYSQSDVTELARVFTGWGLCPAQRIASSGAFCFDASRHDPGDKVLLGLTIRGGGFEEGLQALDLLARHPATARRIAFKLAQAFVADAPPPALVGRLAARFDESGGDIRAVLATLFESPEFWNSRELFGAKFKTPYRYVVSAVRATGMPLEQPLALTGPLTQLGMPLFGCQTPDGYKNTRTAWLSPEAMTRRLSFATILAAGRLPAVAAVDAAPADLAVAAEWPQLGVPLDPDALALVLGSPFSAKTRQILARSPSALRSALILGSPEMMSY